MIGDILLLCFHTPQAVTRSVARPIPSPHPRAIWLPLRSRGSPSSSFSLSSPLESGELVGVGLLPLLESPESPVEVAPPVEVTCVVLVLASCLEPTQAKA